MKVCNKCNINKRNNDFEKYRKTCKKCRNNYKKVRRELVKLSKRPDEKKCVKCEKVLPISEFLLTKNSCKKCLSTYRKKYKSKRVNKNRRNLNLKNKRTTDPVYYYQEKISNAIRRDLKKKGFNKFSITIKEVVGLTANELKQYLEVNPYGFTFKYQVDIDHIVPLSTAKTFGEVLALWHYSNLQLLPSYYNRHIKRAEKWDRGHFEKWLSENKVEKKKKKRCQRKTPRKKLRKRTSRRKR